jgi:myo-inositol-1(or 4)-monophosphatase
MTTPCGRSKRTVSRSAVRDGEGRPPDHDALEQIASAAAAAAAAMLRGRVRDPAGPATKSSPTDIVTQADLDSERYIREALRTATPDAGFVGEESGASPAPRRLRWIVDPLDGTVNFWYGLPVLAVSIAAAVDGDVVAGAVVDVASGETFSAALGHGARLDGHPIAVSVGPTLSQALVTTGFSYRADIRAEQGGVIARLLPRVRDIRCFGSAALQLCWVGCGRTDSYFERDIKLWDYAAAALVATEAGATVELPCPENGSLVAAAAPAVFEPLRQLIDQPD